MYIHLAVITAIFVLAGGSGAFGQASDIVKIDQLTTSIKAEKEKVQVINFWATWCGPCIKELPLFEQLNQVRVPCV